MGFKTRFCFGEKVFVIDAVTAKIKDFEVDWIFVSANSNQLSVKYYPKGSTIGYEEGVCFATKEELLQYIDSDKV